jgi:hypothetical protein
MLSSNISNIFSLMKAQMWNIENIYNLSKLETMNNNLYTFIFI